jgi:hypothetical protein
MKDLDWNAIVMTVIVCVTIFATSTQLKSCASEMEKRTVIHYQYDCEDAPPEHKP